MQLRMWHQYLGALAVLAAFCSQAAAIGFTPGSIVTVRFGDGSGALNSNATAAFLDEYDISGALLQTIAMPTADSGLQQTLTVSGTATSEGALAFSGDGNYLTLGGYDAIPGTAGVTSSTSIGRTAGRVTISTGAVDTSTVFNDGVNTGNIRSVVSNDGMQFWSGNASGTANAGGVRYTTLGSTGASTQLSNNPTNVRVVDIHNGQLYVSTGAGSNNGVNTVGTGLPTTGSQTISLFPGMGVSGSSPYGYVFKDANTLYVADDRSVASGGGIQKWVLNSGTWTNTVTFSTGTNGVRGLGLGFDVNNNPVLFGTTSTDLVMVWDTGNNLPNAPIQTITTAGSNTNFRGLAYMPGGQPLPAPPEPPPPPPAARLPMSGDIVLGLSSSAASTFELIREEGGPTEDGGVKSTAPWQSTTTIQSVEFDNYGGIQHNVNGNLLGVRFNFGNTTGENPQLIGGGIYSFGTNGDFPDDPMPAGQLIGNTCTTCSTAAGGASLGHTGNLTPTTLGGLSVAPDNSKIAVTGTETGTVIVYDYTPGNTLGTGSPSLAGGRQTPSTDEERILTAGSTQGTAWLDNDTVLAFATFGLLYEVDATTMAATEVASVTTPSIGGNFTSMAYNPEVSDYVYAMYSGFAANGPEPEDDNNKGILYIFDPADDYELIHEIDLSTSLGSATGREIALDAEGNLFISSFGGTVSFVTAADLAAGTDNSSVVWYDSTTFSSFNGLDIGFGEDEGVPGDINGDGLVNTLDYVVGRIADAPGTGQELADWAANYTGALSGSGTGANAAVPEPATLGLLALGLAAAGCGRRRAA